MDGLQLAFDVAGRETNIESLHGDQDVIGRIGFRPEGGRTWGTPFVEAEHRFAVWQELQNARHVPVRLQEQPDEFSSTICPESARNAINQRVLESVRNEFEVPTWTAFWLTAVDGKTAAEVSAEVGISTASVYQAKSRVLRRLRQRLAETPD